MKKILLLLFCVAVLQTASAQKPLFNAPFGVQAYTFRSHFPTNVVGTLDTIKMFGITELEGNVPKGMTPETFKKLCDERGISIPATGGDYNQLVRNPDSIADIAKRLGAKFVMCAWIPHKRGAFSLDDAKKAVADFNKIGKALNAHGLTFCYHDHGYEFQKYGDGTLLDYMIQNTTPQYVSFEMDVLWTIHGGGNPVALLKKYKKRWKLMHVKDLKRGIVGDLTGGTPAENDVVLGEGQADFPNIIKVAKKIGIKHFFIEDESNFEMVNVPKSIAYLKGLKK
jgi:sugar phosphate isomerase/epimerase